MSPVGMKLLLYRALRIGRGSLHPNIWPKVGWFPHPHSVCPDPLLCLFDQAWHSVVVGFGSTGICRPGRWGGTNTWVWLPGICRVPLVTFPLQHGCLASLRRASGCGGRQTPSITSLLLASSCHLKKPAKLVGSCGALLRSYRFGRSNCTSFHSGISGEHLTVGSCEHEHLAVCGRAVHGWVG